MCYPFQVAGTHDAFRPAVAYQDGLPSQAMSRENDFYDAGNGLIIFLGEEPWYRLDIYGDGFFQAIKGPGTGADGGRGRRKRGRRPRIWSAGLPAPTARPR